MAGRKATSSSITKPSAKKQKISPPSVYDQNPFWKIYGPGSKQTESGIDFHDNVHDANVVCEKRGGNDDLVDRALDGMLRFMELSKKRNPGHDRAADGLEEHNTDQEHNQVLLLEKTVHNLLAQMDEFQQESVHNSHEPTDRRANTTTNNNVFVSAEDIARMLLPWSMKGILQNSYKKSSTQSQSSSSSMELLYWRTMSYCLDFFLGCYGSQQDGKGSSPKDRTRYKSLNVLTLSTMHKLVPVALQCSLQENDDSRKDANSAVSVQETAQHCFCQLVNHFYRPPFDVICDTLIPILTTRHSRMSSIWTRVTISTLRLMNLRLASANPKKSFQLLVRPKVFLDLATIYLYATSLEQSKGTNDEYHTELKEVKILFNDLIRNGIYSLEHHMDGFRSLQLDIPVSESTSRQQKRAVEKVGTSKSSSAKSSFRGYQEGLFKVLESFLIADNDNNKADAFDSNDATTISSLVPLLVNLFLEQVSKIQQQQVASKSLKKNKATEKLGHLQFQFFSRLSGYVLNGLISSENTEKKLRLSLFAMLGDNLDILLRHNIYQPSLGNNSERSFLDKIGKEIIQLMLNHQAKEKEITFDEWKKSLRILDVLIQLNHTILHDQLTEILARCLACDSMGKSLLDTSRAPKESVSFLVTIIATYGRLRQLDYFYLCLFDAMKELLRDNDLHRVTQHLAFADNLIILTHLGRAIQGSPIQQIRKIFSNLNDFIVRGSLSTGTKDAREVTTVATSVVTKFFVGLLQNVRVDSNSFNDIYPICNDIMSGSVMSLTHSSDDMKNALIVCAWTIHLKNRCEFWIDEKPVESSSKEKFDVPPALDQLLRDATTGAGAGARVNDSARNDPYFLESLKFLACQRIQQLHGECYEKQRLAYATNAEQYSTATETQEAENLVGFILQRRGSNGKESSTSKMISQWAVLAESITIWAPHATENNIDLFLNLLLHSVAIVDQSCTHESNLLLAVLNDSSFYEIPNVSQRLGMNIASFVAENVQEIISQCDGSPNITCPTLQNGWNCLSFDDWARAPQSGISLTCAPRKNVSEIDKLLGGILRVLDTINDVGISIWKDCKDGLKVFQSLMQMESICIKLYISQERSFLDMKVRLLSALRTAASRVFATVSLDVDGRAFETEKRNCTALFTYILEDSFSMIDHDSSSRTIHRCIDSCTMIMEAFVDRYIPLGTRSAMIMINILNSRFDQADVSRGGFQYLLLTTLAIILLKKFGRHFGEGDHAVIIELFRVIKERIWGVSFEYCFNAPQKTEFLFQNQSIILVAETLRLSATHSSAQLIQMSSLENKIVARLSSLLLTRDPDELETRAISYLVGCLAMAKPSRTVRQELTYQLLLANLKQKDMFLTPLSILAKSMEKDELDDFLSKLTSNIVDVSTTTTKLRIIHTVVLSATEEAQLDAISNHSAIIMNNCLQVMTQVAKQIDVNSNSILEVSSLIVDMASRKDMMVLRERDIALILARITSTVSFCEERGDDEITEFQLKAYEASFSLVSLFLQRFSKQVHNCVSSLVISLTTMLQFALRKSLPSDAMSLCGQKFSRLCELLLPHGDVYKKHIICLILRFVNSLRQDVHPVAKKSLLPGIYCLLDIIQDHETMQLNSMLDEECRALLRSVHEGYKKIHVYKGQ